MKKLSKHSKLVLGIAVVIMAFLGSYSYRIRFWEQNVFDQIYYSRVHYNTKFSEVVSPFGYYRILFKDMPQLCKKDYDEESDDLELTCMLYEQYDDEFLEDGHEITFDFFVYYLTLYIKYEINTEDSREVYVYEYSPIEKTLTYRTSNPENTEMKNFLFDRVLSDWFAANKGRTRFSSQNLGEYTFIDTTE